MQDLIYDLNYYFDCMVDVKYAKDVYMIFRQELLQRNEKIKAALQEEEKKKEDEIKRIAA